MFIIRLILTLGVYYRNNTYEKPWSYKLSIINGTKTLILTLHISRELGLELNFGISGTRIKYGGGTDDCPSLL